MEFTLMTLPVFLPDSDYISGNSLGDTMQTVNHPVRTIDYTVADEPQSTTSEQLTPREILTTATVKLLEPLSRNTPHSAAIPESQIGQSTSLAQ